MKNFSVKQSLIASVSAAVIGMSGVGTAQADSLLAPVVFSDVANGFVTVLSMKVRGTGRINHQWRQFGADAANLTNLHYTWLRKANNLAGVVYSTGATGTANRACSHENNNGTVSPWDMVFQTVNQSINGVAFPGGQEGSPLAVGAGAGNGTTLTRGPVTPFYGMAVIDDEANIESTYTTGSANTLQNRAGEGDMSGFAYVMHLQTGLLWDYKMLNNHRSKASGDFSAGFTSKRSVDLSWNPTLRDQTVWIGVATGTGMTNGSNWAGRVTISSARDGDGTQNSPNFGPFSTSATGATTGVYDNNEVVTSGDVPMSFTCMTIFNRGNFLNSTQQAATTNGGWTRRSIVANSGGATGAMIYKAENKLVASQIAGSLVSSFIPETSGHLRNSANGQHPNRPF